MSEYPWWFASTNAIFRARFYVRSLQLKYSSFYSTFARFVSNVTFKIFSDGAALVHTSLRNNSNLSLLYEYILHRAYEFPLRFKSEAVNEEAIFIPFGYDKPTLIADSFVKIDVTKPYNEVIPQPATKKNNKE